MWYQWYVADHCQYSSIFSVVHVHCQGLVQDKHFGLTQTCHGRVEYSVSTDNFLWVNLIPEEMLHQVLHSRSAMLQQPAMPLQTTHDATADASQ